MANTFGYMWNDIEAYYEQFYNSSSEEFSNSLEERRSVGSIESEGEQSSGEERKEDEESQWTKI